MPKNLLSLPSPDEDDAIVNLADWVEAKAMLSDDQNSSREDLRKAMSRDSDIRDERSEQLAIDVFSELEDRVKACGVFSDGTPGYPFFLDATKTLLTMRMPAASENTTLYLFLLAITRGDMSSSKRKLGGVDPTKVFEQLCATVLQNFWGGKTPHSDVLIFGTARPKTKSAQIFPGNIANLCDKIGDGGGWKKGAQSAGSGDGKLDLVVWRKFSDERDGSLLGFAQCKTGVNWEEHLTKLNPESFSDTYFIKPLALHPVKIYMVPCRISAFKWRRNTKEGGLLMDRCRLIQYSVPTDEAHIRSTCRVWLNEAIRLQRVSMMKVAKA